MGGTYLNMKQNEIARIFFRQSISFAKNTNNFLNSYSAGLAGNLNGISQTFFNDSQYVVP